MKPAVRAGVLAVALVLAAGCSSRFETFPFLTMEGQRIEIWQSRRVPRDQETRFQAVSGVATSPVYHLAAPITVTSGGEAFAFSYTSDISRCTLTIFSDRKKPLMSAALPRTSGTPLHYLVPLERGAKVWGYQLSTDGPQGVLTFTGAGTSRLVHGFAIATGSLVVDGSVEVASASAGAVSARISAVTREEMGRCIWLISLTMQDGAEGGRVVFTDPDGATAAFDVNPASTPPRLDFARGSIPFLPRDISFTGALQSVQISQVPADAPLPADPGTILGWDQSSWRRPDFEVFSWSRFPHVLIMDIATYEAQDALFKRIAFYVEKAGHAGRIESSSALAGLHGYNAHDYRAEDLARFFTAAEKEAKGLSAEEGELLKILVDNGVLQKSDAGYAAGQGAVLSLSRSSSAVLRRLLLTHECFHGAYFSLPAFRDATEKEWNSLSAVERAVWEDYLAAHAYDTSDHYLVVNEFQSYLMQQERAGIWGFQDVTLGRMRSESARAAGLARQLAATHPTAFLKEFDALDEALQAAGGPPGGQALAVTREGG